MATNTNPGTNLSDSLARALQLIDAAVIDASRKVATGPDNPAVRRLDGNVNAFIIQSSEFGKVRLSPDGKKHTGASWLPFDHDWLSQYRYARDLLVSRRFAVLRELLTGASYLDPACGRRSFAPKVIEHIQAITGDLRLPELDAASNNDTVALKPAPTHRMRP